MRSSLWTGLITKIFLWENHVIRGNFRRSRLSASFHPHPDLPKVSLKANASSDRRRQHVAYLVDKSVDKDVKKNVTLDLSQLMTTVMGKTGVHRKADTHIPGRTVILEEYNAMFDLMPTHG